MPDAKPLLNLSKYLIANRHGPSATVPFPGVPLLSDLEVLSAAQSIGPLSDNDLAALRELRNDLMTVCTHAQQRGVKLIVDAEHRHVIFHVFRVAWVSDTLSAGIKCVHSVFLMLFAIEIHKAGHRRLHTLHDAGI